MTEGHHLGRKAVGTVKTVDPGAAAFLPAQLPAGTGAGPPATRPGTETLRNRHIS